MKKHVQSATGRPVIIYEGMSSFNKSVSPDLLKKYTNSTPSVSRVSVANGR